MRIRTNGYGCTGAGRRARPASRIYTELVRTVAIIAAVLVAFRIIMRIVARRQRERMQQELERLRKTPVLHLND